MRLGDTDVCICIQLCIFAVDSRTLTMLTYTGVCMIDPFTYRYTHMCVCVLMGVTAGHRSWFPDLSNGYNAGEGLAGIAVTICVPASRRSQMGVPGVKPTTL